MLGTICGGLGTVLMLLSLALGATNYLHAPNEQLLWYDVTVMLGSTKLVIGSRRPGITAIVHKTCWTNFSAINFNSQLLYNLQEDTKCTLIYLPYSSLAFTRYNSNGLEKQIVELLLLLLLLLLAWCCWCSRDCIILEPYIVLAQSILMLH